LPAPGVLLRFLQVAQVGVQERVLLEEASRVLHAVVDGADPLCAQAVQRGHQRVDASFQLALFARLLGAYDDAERGAAGQSLADSSHLDDALFAVGQQLRKVGLEVEASGEPRRR
jgi:hypothetical protein